MNPLRLVGAVVSPLRRVVRFARATRRTVEQVPDLVEAILVLPTLSRQLETVAFATATLPEMHREIQRVRGDTTTLRGIDETLVRMAVELDRIDVNTARVEQLAEVMLPLRGAALRLGRFAERRPPRGV